MALNIGANDVANNMGPAVGANALSMGGAIAIAAIFESAGALLAGGDVVSTVAKGIIAPENMLTTAIFIFAMLSALLAAALWVNLATWIGAPVSTTHSVVGGVMGAGIAAAGFAAVNWPTMYKIAASWVISPVLGGAIAALFLWLIKSRIIYQSDKISAAKKWVPFLVGIMGGAFAAYLALKGIKKIIKIDFSTALMIGLAIGVVIWLVMIPVIKKQAEGCKLIFTTSRPNSVRAETENALFGTLGFHRTKVIMDLPHGPRVLVNDFSKTNPGPSAIAINATTVSYTHLTLPTNREV